MYELPKIKKKGHVILGLDPGSVNMGIAATDFTEAGPRVIANALMHNPIRGLTKDLQNKSTLFLNEVQLWVEEYEVDTIVIERFQTRNLNGVLIEEVAMMIGMLLERFSHLQVMLITAASWKNAFHRQYSYRLDDIYKVCKTPDHLLDATLMTLYVASTRNLFNKTLDIRMLMHGVETMSLTPLINRRRTELGESDDHIVSKRVENKEQSIRF